MFDLIAAPFCPLYNTRSTDTAVHFIVEHLQERADTNSERKLCPVRCKRFSSQMAPESASLSSQIKTAPASTLCTFGILSERLGNSHHSGWGGMRGWKFWPTGVQIIYPTLGIDIVEALRHCARAGTCEVCEPCMRSSQWSPDRMYLQFMPKLWRLLFVTAPCKFSNSVLLARPAARRVQIPYFLQLAGGRNPPPAPPPSTMKIAGSLLPTVNARRLSEPRSTTQLIGM